MGISRLETAKANLVNGKAKCKFEKQTTHKQKRKNNETIVFNPRVIQPNTVDMFVVQLGADPPMFSRLKFLAVKF